MWQNVWPDNIAIDCVKGLLAGGASLALQWIVPRTIRVLNRLRVSLLGKLPQDKEAAIHRRTERRLAAILAADVVGYSRLTEADEEGTHDRLTTLQRELVDPIIREHRGRIVKNTGDGALVEFRSVVDAVRCAIEVQRALAVRNARAPQDHRIDFRLGVSLGDVIVEPNDIYGHSVNVAVRLEGLAVPGGICLTANAWHCVRGKIAAQVIDLGELHLKNITEPAQVYAIPPAAGRVTLQAEHLAPMAGS
jgi:adenylate cyclase